MHVHQGWFACCHNVAMSIYDDIYISNNISINMLLYKMKITELSNSYVTLSNLSLYPVSRWNTLWSKMPQDQTGNVQLAGTN